MLAFIRLLSQRVPLGRLPGGLGGVAALALGAGLVLAATIGTPSAAAAGGWSGPTSIDGNAGLESVSCASSSFCVAVDGEGNETTLDGSSWSAPASVSPNGGLYSVSCASSSFCAAVGGVPDEGVGDAVMFDGGSWSAPETIADTWDMASVSCPFTDFCAATAENIIDDYGYQYPDEVTTFSGSSEPTAGGTGWASPQVLETTDNNGDGPVSCGADGFCVAFVGVGHGDYSRLNPCATACAAAGGGLWSAPVASSDSSVASVSCVSSSFCMAVDSYGGAISFDGSSWSAPVSIDSNAASLVGAGGTVFLNSVSCVSMSFCMAVDTGGNVISFDGTSWSAPVSITSGALVSVSCATVSFCVAVDTDGDAYTYTGSGAAGQSTATTSSTPSPTSSTSSTPSTTSTQPAPTPPAPPPLPRVPGPSASVSGSGSLSLGVSCPAGGAACSGSLSLTVTTAGGKVASAAAARHRPKRRTLTLASKKFTVAAGRSGTVKLKLSKAGISLLKRAKHHRLKVTVVIRAGGRSRNRALTLKLAQRQP